MKSLCVGFIVIGLFLYCAIGVQASRNTTTPFHTYNSVKGEMVFFNPAVYIGRPVILHFWTPYDGTASFDGAIIHSTYPFEHELREFYQVSTGYPEATFAMFHILTGGDEKGAKKIELGLTSLFDRTTPSNFMYFLELAGTKVIIQEYGIYIFPATVFIGKNGEIVAIRNGSLKWKNNVHLKKLMDELCERRTPSQK